ncbi:MAG: RNA polymerase factor sigma-54 [Paraprevotella sp.]|nr:RNA polymerase factor sigma-54 [Paraprevotella sp.]MBP3472143.1 RNA polymerase factor sigma-54 [Paraprevotella sp.]
MAQKNIQTQTLQQTQTLSPQQVLLVRLLEMPVSELEQRVEREMMENGALEESDTRNDGDDLYYGEDNEGGDRDDEGDLAPAGLDTYGDTPLAPSAELSQALGDYRSVDDVPDYLLRNSNRQETPEAIEYSDTASFYEQMKEQMGECDLTPHEQVLMEYLIGSLESDGMLKKSLSVLADELEVYHNVETTEEELAAVLKKLQDFEPAGIGARNLQECLLLQIEHDEQFHTPLKQKEHLIIEKYYDEFTHKRWDKIQQRLKLTDDEAELLQRELRRLNPRPGSAMGEAIGRNYQQIIPDFIVETADDGTLTMSLNQGDVPELRISDSFMELLKQSEGARSRLSRPEKEALQYTRQKIEKAQYFIEAIKQRRHTLTVTMQAIIALQRPFFEEGDELLLRPMILKDVAERTGLDISTVSRVSNSKYVQTNYGIYPLKWFFSDGYTTDDGQEIATRKIQSALRELVDNEDRKKPLSDEALTALLNEKGFPIARRTVAKYREQLGIPVARLRK